MGWRDLWKQVYAGDVQAGQAAGQNATGFVIGAPHYKCTRDIILCLGWSLVRNHRWNNWCLIKWEWLEPSRKWWWWSSWEVVSNRRFWFIRQGWREKGTTSCKAPWDNVVELILKIHTSHLHVSQLMTKLFNQIIYVLYLVVVITNISFHPCIESSHIPHHLMLLINSSQPSMSVFLLKCKSTSAYDKTWHTMRISIKESKNGGSWTTVCYL